MEALPDLEDTLRPGASRPHPPPDRGGARGLLPARILHGKIDILRAELQSRLKKEVGEGRSPLHEVDVDKLAEILAAKAPPARRLAVSYVHCPECGFQNPEAANYCSKCGALLIHDEPGQHTTMTFTPEEVAEDDSLSLADLAHRRPGPRRARGRRPAGETFGSTGDRVDVGRSPDDEVFLDDVTVSRAHAVLVKRTTATTSRTRTA